VAGSVAANRNSAADQQAQQQEVEQPPAAEAPPTMDEKLASVAKLAELHTAGTLTDEEFAQQKAQILGS
jgi:hypothetical protein